MIQLLKRLRGPALTFCAGFLALALVRWAFADGTGWLLVGGVLTVVAVGAVLALRIYGRSY